MIRDLYKLVLRHPFFSIIMVYATHHKFFFNSSQKAVPGSEIASTRAVIATHGD